MSGSFDQWSLLDPQRMLEEVNNAIGSKVSASDVTAIVPSLIPPPPSAGSSTAPVTANGLLNVNSRTLQFTRRMLARVRAGSGRGRIAMIGDSLFVGAGAGSGGVTNLHGARPYSVPVQLAALLNAAPLLKAGASSIFGDQGVGISAADSYTAYNPQVSMGANWSIYTGVTVFGGGAFFYTAGAVNNLALTPPDSFDSVTIYTAPGSAGTGHVIVDSGSSLGTVPANTGSTVVATTISVGSVQSGGSHVINVVPDNNGTLFVLGILPYNSTAPAIDIISGAIWGAGSSTIAGASAAYSPLNMLGTLAPDLTIMEQGGINMDAVAYPGDPTAALAGYATDMQASITKGLVSGDVLLTTWCPPGTTQQTHYGAQFVNVLKVLALANSCPLLDVTQRWGSFALGNALFPYVGDNLHPPREGYSDVALAQAQVILNQ